MPTTTSSVSPNSPPGVDLVTYEFENVPVDAARFVETLRPVFPPPAALEAAQDRLSEKQLFEEVGLEVPPYAPVDSLDASPTRSPTSARPRW